MIYILESVYRIIWRHYTERWLNTCLIAALRPSSSPSPSSPICVSMKNLEKRYVIIVSCCLKSLIPLNCILSVLAKKPSETLGANFLIKHALLALFLNHLLDHSISTWFWMINKLCQPAILNYVVDSLTQYTFNPPTVGPFYFIHCDFECMPVCTIISCGGQPSYCLTLQLYPLTVEWFMPACNMTSYGECVHKVNTTQRFFFSAFR